MLKKNKEMDELMNSSPGTPRAGGRGSMSRSDRMQAASGNDVEKTNLMVQVRELQVELSDYKERYKERK